MKILRALLLILLMLVSVTIFFIFLTTAGGTTGVDSGAEMEFNSRDTGLI